MNAIQSWARLGGLAFALVAGCSSSTKPLGVGIEPNSGGNGGGSGGKIAGTGGNGGTGGTLALDGGVGAALQVFLTADRTTVCPGECAELSVSVSGGQAKHAYAWSEDLGANSGPHRVCPDATTTYQVTVSDSGGTGEFTQAATVERELTIHVAQDCVAGDGGMKSSGEVRTAEVMCTNTWSAPSLNLSPHKLHLNDDGHTVLLGQSAGAIDFGGVQLEGGNGGWTSFVAEVDENCQVVWAKRIGESASQIYLISAVRAEDGSIYLTGYFSGFADFGQGPVAALLGAQSAGVVFKIGADRATQWVIPFGASAPPLVFGPQYNVGHSLALHPSGDVLFGFMAGQSTVLGGDYTIDPGSTIGPHGWLAKLSPAGDVRWQRDLGLGWLSAIAAGPDGSAAAVGWSNEAAGSGAVTGAQNPLGLDGSAFLVRLSDDGVALPEVLLPDGQPGVFFGSSGFGTLAFDGQGNVLVGGTEIEMAGDDQSTTYDPYVTSLEGSGAVQRVLPLGEGRGPNGSIRQPAIDTDADFNLISEFVFAGPASVDGHEFDNTAGSAMYGIVAGWSPDGQLQWLHHEPLGDGDKVHSGIRSVDIHSTLGATVLLSAYDDTDEDNPVQSITYTRLAP